MNYGKFKSKPVRPHIQKIIIAEMIDDEIVFQERFIIVNSKGETLHAQIFTNKKEALEWLDTHHPASNYQPE
ncbi:hypothetical protein [Burkholderia anthina]|uniref:hypothetical protein n=1 Tax=Burkholderia TaxID=32008 RepID=UPI0015888C76|nr:hypothetical protein [Burkholderia anthina]MBY4867022.1 hypothetical protein [Burkholderia anthina]